jgi:hypothetical protein
VSENGSRAGQRQPSTSIEKSVLLKRARLLHPSEGVKISLLPTLLLVLVACAPATSAPPPADGSSAVHFAAERVSSGVIRLSLDNGEHHPIGYNLCPSALQRRSGAEWVNIPSDQVCTMQLNTLNPGADATFEKQLPASLPAGEYRYVTSIESPLGSTMTGIATSPFTP